VNNVTSCFIE